MVLFDMRMTRQRQEVLSIEGGKHVIESDMPLLMQASHCQDIDTRLT
jgi:hypothetical protein